MRRTTPLFPPVHKESEQNDSLCEEEQEPPPSESEQDHGMTVNWKHGVMGEWREWNDCFSAPSDVKRKSPLVEWARGKGLTVLPHPSLLSNNYSQIAEK